MYTFKPFLVIVLASYVIAAPSDEPAECKPIKGKDKELGECCAENTKPEEDTAVEECLKLIKNKDDKKGPPKIEGYDCVDDCIWSKLGFLTADKKMDTAKVNAAVKTSFTGEWATVGPKIVAKCLSQVALKTGKEECSSGSDTYSKCIFRETHINCPAKFWTNSDLCNANKERLTKCPEALPFLPEAY